MLFGGKSVFPEGHNDAAGVLFATLPGIIELGTSGTGAGKGYRKGNRVFESQYLRVEFGEYRRTTSWVLMLLR